MVHSLNLIHLLTYICGYCLHPIFLKAHKIIIDKLNQKTLSEIYHLELTSALFHHKPKISTFDHVRSSC